jgi:regulatory protein
MRLLIQRISRPVPTRSDHSDSWHGDVTLGVREWTGEVERVNERPPGPVQRGLEADPEAAARKILLDQLSASARSRKELADKLKAKCVPDDVASPLLERFEEVGLIDDKAFARAWIASRQPGKGLARQALAQELRRKGIDDELARQALDEIDPVDEEQAARNLVRRKLRSMEKLDGTTRTRRLAGMLARKGYSSDLAFSVIKDELSQADLGFN